MVHLFASLISFPAIVVGMFVLARTFLRIPAWRSVGRATVYVAASSLSLFIVQGEGPLGGLLQRLLVSVITLWLIAVAWRARGATGRPEAVIQRSRARR
jgi:hypothetical protein